MVRFDGEKTPVGWSSQPNVFSEARQSGFHTGLAGWCHPYCEVIGKSLTKCDEVKDNASADFTLKASMFSHAQGLISTIPLLQQATIPIIQRVAFFNQIVTTGERRKYTVRYNRVLESALNAAVDPNLDLVFVHSPAPHPPGIYDRTKNDFSLESKNGYVDNLKLVDRTIGELRRAMEQTALWEGASQAPTVGFARGLTRTLARTGIGLYEVVTFPFPPYSPLLVPKSRLYPDSSIRTRTYPWGGLELSENPVFPDSYAPGVRSSSLFDTDTSLGFSGGDVCPWFPGSRFNTLGP